MNEKVIEKEIEFIKQELAEVKHINSDVRELAIQLKELVIEMKHMRETQINHENRIKSLEEKPSKRYDSVISYTITTIISLIIGFIFATLGLKK